MNVIENLIDSLAEECAEIAQRCSKANRFGPGEIQPGQPHRNSERIEGELNDLLGVVDLLNELGVLNFKPDPERIRAKKVKVVKFLDYSMECGVLVDREELMPRLRALVGQVKS